MDFQDKKILITGSTRGIGFATAKLFLENGANVAINGTTEHSVQKAGEQLVNCDTFVLCPGDMRQLSQCKSVITRAIHLLGGLDILVNSAGICHAANIEDSDESLWDQTLDINLKATFFCSQYAVPTLKKSRGTIINLASDAGLQGERQLSVYCASKGGVVNLTRALALELAPHIRVNCVCPGYVDTDMVRRDVIDCSHNPDMTEQNLKLSTPMQRIVTPEEVAQAIAYLASNEARFITGASLQIDGGTTAGH